MIPRILGSLCGEALALVAGLMLPLSLAPFDQPWLAPVSLLLLLACVLHPVVSTHLTPGRLALRYFLYGIGSFGLGVSWVYVSIHDYGYTSVPFAVFITVLWTVGLSAVLAAPWWWFHRRLHLAPVGWQSGLGPPMAFAGLWVLNEWTRSWLLTGFPWLYVGYSQTESLLGGWAPVLGVYGVSLAVVLPVALVFAAVCQPGRARVALAVVVAGVVGLGAELGRQHAWTHPVPGQVQPLVLVQGNVAQEQKWRPEQREAIRALYAGLTQPHLRPGQLVVWPEAAIPELYTPDHPFFLQVRDALARQGGGLITGVPSLHYDENGHRIFYNSLLGLGEATGFYHKRRLVPFGEYVPLQSLLEGLLDFFKLPISDFRRGPAEQAGLSTGKMLAAGSICYEIAYPDLVASQAGEADFLLTVSNDSWFGGSIGPHQHLQMAQMRARENGRMLVRATSNGITALVAPDGSVMERIPQFEVAVLQGRVQAWQGKTLFQRTGSLPVLLLSVLCCLPLVWARRR